MISHRYIYYIDRESDERNCIDIINDKGSDEINKKSENNEDIFTDDIKVLKLRALSSKIDIENIEKESDDRNSINMIDDKESD